jgi:hypothetical protein
MADTQPVIGDEGVGREKCDANVIINVDIDERKRVLISV